MLGYVTIEKGELKVREYELYRGYYCGICKSIARRYGQIPRMTLSYDAVFLALILSGLSEETEEFQAQRCIVHPVEKRPTLVHSPAMDYAADVMVILAYHKFLDDWKDEKSGSALAGKTALCAAYRKLKKRHQTICRQVEETLENLSSLEKSRCPSLDQTGSVFAELMELLFAGYFTGTDEETGQQRVLKQLGKSLGQWIYAVDALDDWEKDRRDGTYNPLIYRKNGLEGIGDILYNYLAEVAKSYDLLDLKKNREIIENIIFMGLRRRTDLILKERTNIDEQSI